MESIACARNREQLIFLGLSAGLAQQTTQIVARFAISQNLIVYHNFEIKCLHKSFHIPYESLLAEVHKVVNTKHNQKIHLTT